MRKPVGIIAAVLALALLVGLPIQATADQICACYQKEHGQLRIVDNHSECLKSELAIFLNATFVQEPPGPLPEGELCWDVQWQDRPNYIMKLKIIHMGDGYYLVLSDMTQVGDDFAAWIGSAKYVGNEIRMSVHETHSDSQPIPFDNADDSGCQYFLDPVTLDGTGWCNTASFDPIEDSGEVDFSTGTLTYTECP